MTSLSISFILFDVLETPLLNEKLFEQKYRKHSELAATLIIFKTDRKPRRGYSTVLWYISDVELLMSRCDAIYSRDRCKNTIIDIIEMMSHLSSHINVTVGDCCKYDNVVHVRSTHDVITL